MPDTVRTDAQILALFADNTSGDIGAQDLRDGYVTLRARDAVLEAALTQTLTPRIAASSDDAIESSVGAMNLTALTLSFNDTNINGVRFLVPEIPQGAHILSATLTFTPNATTNGAATIDIWGLDEDAAGTFTADANNITSRSLTDAQVQWSIPTNSWPSGTPVTSPDLTAIAQEIVDRTGFDGVLAFRVQKVASSGSNRSAISFDDTPGSSPKLTVQYLGVPPASEGGGGDPEPAGSTYVSVVDFGAEPSTPDSGIVDASAGIQAAIDYVANDILSPTSQKLGGTVFIPEGTWYLSVPIRMKTRVDLLGASRTGTILRVIGSGGFTGTGMIILNNNLVNFTSIRNMTLQGSSSPSGLNGINYQNANDVNSDTIFDVGDPFHIFSDLEFQNITASSSAAIAVNARATLMLNINIHQCRQGILIQGSDNKLLNSDISWISERACVITGGNNKLANVKVWYCGANPPGTSTGDATYTEADGFVVQASRCTLVGCEAQDVSRHGLHIVNGDQNRIDVVLDNIGNFRIMQGQGVLHPTTVAKSAIRLGSPSNGANYNRISVTLAQRSVNPDLQAVIWIDNECSDNHIDVMHNPAQKSEGAPVIHVDRGDALRNVVYVNGERQHLVVSSIAAGLDDGFETISSTVVTATGNDAGVLSTRLHFFRFLVPDLPQGANILSARVQFSAGAATSGAMDITINGEDADAAATITVANGNISGRALTTATVTWADVPAWSSTAPDDRCPHQLTPDLSAIVQEIVDRAGFAGVLAFILTGSSATNNRNIAFEENTSRAEATLTVVYRL